MSATQGARATISRTARHTELARNARAWCPEQGLLLGAGSVLELHTAMHAPPNKSIGLQGALGADKVAFQQGLLLGAGSLLESHSNECTT